MGLIATSTLSGAAFKGRVILPDNDFLSALFSDYNALADFLSLASTGTILIDPLIKFEFLRTVFLPEQRILKEQFISADEVFLPAPEHQTIFANVSENAYTLSYVYGQHKCIGASTVDTFLAARAILYGEKSIIITGNRKDFPGMIFDLLGVFNSEEKSGNIRAYSVVAFNKLKYDTAVAQLKHLETRHATKKKA